MVEDPLYWWSKACVLVAHCLISRFLRYGTKDLVSLTAALGMVKLHCTSDRFCFYKITINLRIVFGSDANLYISFERKINQLKASNNFDRHRTFVMIYHLLEINCSINSL